jgi:hypothetical protein
MCEIIGKSRPIDNMSYVAVSYAKFTAERDWIPESHLLFIRCSLELKSYKELLFMKPFYYKNFPCFSFTAFP